MAKAPLGTIPLYVREGAILPRGDIVQLNNNWEPNWAPKLRLEIFPARKQASGFDYFTGNGVQRITVQPGADALSVQFGDLRANGTVVVHCKGVTAVMRNGFPLREGTEYKYSRDGETLEVPFSGAATLSIKGAQSLFSAPPDGHE
jgi:hypothetical protein